MSFDPLTELAALRQQTATIRKRRYAPSRLDRHAGELLALHRAGASTAELQRWLAERGILVAPGDFYGPASGDYVRVGLTGTDERIAAAVDRLTNG